MLNWANRFNIFCFLDNNNYVHIPPEFDCILAIGSKRSINLQKDHSFTALKDFHNAKPAWLFGHFGYDLKNEVEALVSQHQPYVDFGLGFFFEPEVVVEVKKNLLKISSDVYLPEEIFKTIQQQPASITCKKTAQLTLESSMTQAAYLKAVQALQHHIRRGDCYEINFCQQYFSHNAVLNPLFTFLQLQKHSPNPFAALYKLNGKYCLCASPERYLKKEGSKLTSQPIKGTSKRYLTDAKADEVSRTALLNSGKERSENVMVVDLVRNDLSRICKEGTVAVSELFGIYSFPQVHQMISTVTGTLQDVLHWTDAIKATFPMGSMTGAPKKRVMELIDAYEPAARGLFSGAIGYVTPGQDFDFNVVIRSIFYDEQAMQLSFSVGSAITFASKPQDEYNETLLKAEAIMKVLEVENPAG
ncbi:MAG: anthranilate synthase component I family protein [Chitinophagaceae bacterium]|nr:MAG: anthranilate synthase component I family protein [Chitinophagaceae bacterium]